MFRTEDRRETPLIAAAGGLAFGAMAILAAMIDSGRFELPASVPVQVYEASSQIRADETVPREFPSIVRHSPGEERRQDRPASTVVSTPRADTTPLPAITHERLSTNLHILFWLLAALLTCGLALLALLAETRRKARKSAMTDELTGLSNRRAFSCHINEYFQARGNRRDATAAMLLFDIDNFKLVNDEHGHDGGDWLLRMFSDRVSKSIGPDCLFARLGGDEFAIALFGENAEKRAHETANRLIAIGCEPYEIAGRSLKATSSVGGVVFGGDLTNIASIMRLADIALYNAKENERSTVCFYDESMELKVTKRAALVRDLRHAVENGELSLHFQPIVELADSKLVSFEALLRWRHPTRGFVSPGEFIPIAEESGLIVPIGLWVIEEACLVAASWPGQIGFTVNLSPRQFGDDRLVPTIIDALDRNGVDPARMTVELTETAIIEHDGVVLSALKKLRGKGVKIALDDFGTGFASLSYLTRFPFDVVKIDQSFVREASRNNNADVVISSICDLASRLGLETVAEGIESLDHMELVRKAGCNRGQGYLFGRPEPTIDCTTRIAIETLRGVTMGTIRQFEAHVVSKTG
ncbi:bifunctional diguanylate cyclase/phosphodiesterase [Fulvimarina sp. MAC3]|uniref:putative bifunctional diguanylate cyclase/phosphodiesterase n=1 Tax=Fulvimarina sp. MAC3 TaxID=3148887 RepID=UPI0031FD2EC3